MERQCTENREIENGKTGVQEAAHGESGSRDAGTEGRMPGLDLVRVIAAVSVVAVHFFLNCGYYATPMAGGRMFLLTAMRWLFMICVPLYMMLTGYLKINKKADAAHYLGILPVAAGYLIISALKLAVDNGVYGKIYTLRDGVRAILDYSMSWYAAMYMGMMLLIPFLNALWRGLSGDRRQKRLLLLSLLILTAVPTVVPYAVPTYWEALYPITYYYLGAYIREEQPLLQGPKAVWTGFGLAGVLLAETVCSFWAAAGGGFSWEYPGGVDSGFGSLPVCASAVMVFLLFYRRKVRGERVRGLLKSISGVSFYLYLFSGIFDTLIYWKLAGVVNMRPDRYLLFIAPATAACFLASFACATVLDKGLKAVLPGQGSRAETNGKGQ